MRDKTTAGEEAAFIVQSMPMPEQLLMQSIVWSNSLSLDRHDWARSAQSTQYQQML